MLSWIRDLILPPRIFCKRCHVECMYIPEAPPGFAFVCPRCHREIVYHRDGYVGR